MQDLDENTRILNELNFRLKSLGDSLWHSKTRSRIKRTWIKDNECKFLGRY